MLIWKYYSDFQFVVSYFSFNFTDSVTQADPKIQFTQRTDKSLSLKNMIFYLSTCFIYIGEYKKWFVNLLIALSRIPIDKEAMYILGVWYFW